MTGHLLGSTESGKYQSRAFIPLARLTYVIKTTPDQLQTELAQATTPPVWYVTAGFGMSPSGKRFYGNVSWEWFKVLPITNVYMYLLPVGIGKFRLGDEGTIVDLYIRPQWLLAITGTLLMATFAFLGTGLGSFGWVLTGSAALAFWRANVMFFHREARYITSFLVGLDRDPPHSGE